MKKIIAGLVAAWVYGLCSLVQAAELKANHPESHVVQPGDTLWDIAAMFLDRPWLWPEIWHINEQVENPHLIFPGDVITLIYIDGKPRITVGNRQSPTSRQLPNGTIKLTPQIREISRGQALTSVPLEAILPFLSGARVVTEQEFQDAPYVVSGDEGRLVNAENHKVYARGITTPQQSKFTFYRRGDNYVDPDTNEVLGVEAIHLGSGTKIRPGDPTTIRIEKSISEVMAGDKLWPTNDTQLRPHYFPHAPEQQIDASIISVYKGVARIGQYDVVVLNKGERNGVEVGHVFTIFQKGKVVEDNYAKTNKNVYSGDPEEETFIDKLIEKPITVKLPDEEAGSLMVFRTFEKVSLALVMEAQRTIHVLDKAKTPY